MLSHSALARLCVSAKARQWPRGAYEAEAEAFRDYWLAEGRPGARKMDWRRAWCNWISQIAARVLRDAKAGVTYQSVSSGSNGPIRAVQPLDSSGECATAKDIRQRLERKMGKGLFDMWVGPSRFDIDGETLTICAPTPLMSVSCFP